jgi:hypothetical protein
MHQRIAPSPANSPTCNVPSAAPFQARAIPVCVYAGRQLGGTFLRAVRQCTLLLLGVFFLSPLYSTLTKAISDDTIIAASVWLLLAHLYMHDYFFETSVADKLSGSLSLACAVAASLLLASRLAQPDKVVRSLVHLPNRTANVQPLFSH